MDATTNTRTALPAPILVGKSPAGVEYWARFEGDVERMEARLAHHRARAAKKTTRRVELTPGQADRIDGLSEESLERFEAEGVTFRRTYVQGPVGTLADLASFFVPEEAADDAAMAADAQTDEEVLFAARAGYASAMLLQARLEGRKMTIATARKAAKRARF